MNESSGQEIVGMGIWICFLLDRRSYTAAGNGIPDSHHARANCMFTSQMFLVPVSVKMRKTNNTYTYTLHLIRMQCHSNCIYTGFTVPYLGVQ